MKRFTLSIIAVFIIALAASSCKSHETCPAYGSQDVIETSTEVPS